MIGGGVLAGADCGDSIGLLKAGEESPVAGTVLMLGTPGHLRGMWQGCDFDTNQMLLPDLS